MNSLLIPGALTFLGIVLALNTYRNIRRGGARYYTLEREAILRRANLTLLLSMLSFIGAVGVLVLEQRQNVGGEAIDGQEPAAGVVTATPTFAVEDALPTPDGTATPAFVFPTATPTPVVQRAMVEGTGGSGLTLRDNPDGDALSVLPDGSIVSLLEDEPIEIGGFTWVRVRTIANDEGWVVDTFLVLRDNQ